MAPLLQGPRYKWEGILAISLDSHGSVTYNVHSMGRFLQRVIFK